MKARAESLHRPHVDARAWLWIGGLAAVLLAARAALHGIHVPGHNALPALSILVLAVSRVRAPGAALAVALPAWAAGSAGWIGDAGGATALLLAAACVEIAARLAPGFSERALACAAVGAVAGALRFLPDLPMWLGALPDPGAPALLSVVSHAGFGALGAALVPFLTRGARRDPTRNSS